ncbi:MAG: hypothetical protein IT388_00660 [Nitrospirales bacterium]|nr:hypothetical protein [Nitrospirales bacterium]
MNHPPYHLRINKAVDRFLLIDILRVLSRTYDLSEYTYYGFGGPFLEDCRLIREYCPDIKLVSIERDADTYKRQEFHRFTNRDLTLVRKELEDYLSQDFASDEKVIFWLDYVDNKYRRLEEFKMLLQKVGSYSIVKITLPAQIYGNPFRKWDSERETSITTEQQRFINDFNMQYREALRSNVVDKEPFAMPHKTIELIVNMIRVTVGKALPHSGGTVFQPLNACHYKDGVPMLSVVGIVCPTEEVLKIQGLFRGWKFANLSWGTPRKIDMPHLSTKERLLIEHLLPTEANDGRILSETLGYSIDKDAALSLEKLRQYEDFHRNCPYFIKAVV